MSAETKWPAGPYEFLEANEPDARFHAGKPFTICRSETLDDLANVYSEDDSTVYTTREQAVALAHLFSASPDLYAALGSVMREIVGEHYRGSNDAEAKVVTDAWAALAKARGEQ